MRSVPVEVPNLLIERDPEVAAAVGKEMERQQFSIVLIASENFPSKPILEVTGTVLTNKYAEGYPNRRYYGGCEFVDMAENIAIQRAKKLFGSEHANVQPHSGTQANMAALSALMKPGETLMGMKLDQGGHLSHGSPVNFSGGLYNAVSYGVNKETELIDFEEVERVAKDSKPKVIICGFTAYSRTVDFPHFRQIADEVGAILLADIAHISGLIAGGAHPSPVSYAHVVTSTSHKTLRGPRGAFILSEESLGRNIDRGVFPRTQGGPFMHVIAGKAICFGEALRPEFSVYAHQVIENSRTLAEVLSEGGMRLISGGTDTHMFLVDLTPLNLSGLEAEQALERVNIFVNRNNIPYDTAPPRVGSGLRLGTAAMTTRGMGTQQMKHIGSLILRTLQNIGDSDQAQRIRQEVLELTTQYQVPGITSEMGYPFK